MDASSDHLTRLPMFLRDRDQAVSSELSLERPPLLT